MMISQFGKTESITDEALQSLVFQVLAQAGELKRVLLLPPDHTRLNSKAGPITAMVYGKLTAEGVAVDILPTLGTHNPMTEGQLRMMFGEMIPLEAFRVHDWRNEVVCVGTIPGERLAELSDGKVDYPVNVEVNRLLFDGYDLILSIGQVVPHEVVGMANYTKNIVVGAGGSDIINKSHFLGAVCNMETILGQTDTPVRRLFNEAVARFLPELPITYILTVMEQDYSTGKMHMRGFFAGEDAEPYREACTLARAVNINVLDREPHKVVVYLDPHEFQSTWLGNKAVYRTRMAIADAGELIVLAPALKEFGEDATIDRLIRKFGYYGTPATLKAVAGDAELAANLGAAAHLIHGSSEGRFSITYCPSEGGLTLDEVRSVGFHAVAYQEMIQRYDPARLVDGWNRMPDGETIFYISNPALGLWAFKDKFEQ
jgi:nickel-dependent lactate racemase